MSKFDVLNSDFRACSFFDPARPKPVKNIVQRLAFPELSFRVQEVQPLLVASNVLNVKHGRISKIDI